MGAALPHTSSRAPAAALGFFQAFFFAVCLVVPLLWLLLLALLWLVPLRPATQRRLLVAAEVAHAWSALDVFLLTLVRACVSACMRTYVSACARECVGPPTHTGAAARAATCNPSTQAAARCLHLPRLAPSPCPCAPQVASLLELDQFSQFIVGDECDGVNRLLSLYFSPLVGGEPRCFVVDAQLEPGVWLLFVASLVSLVSGHLFMHGGARALKDHERRCGRAEDFPPPIWPNPIALGGSHGGARADAPAPALLGAPLLPS